MKILPLEHFALYHIVKTLAIKSLANKDRYSKKAMEYEMLDRKVSASLAKTLQTLFTWIHATVY